MNPHHPKLWRKLVICRQSSTMTTLNPYILVQRRIKVNARSARLIGAKPCDVHRLIATDVYWLKWQRAEPTNALLKTRPKISKHQSIADFHYLERQELGCDKELGELSTWKAVPLRIPNGKIVKARLGGWWIWTIIPKNIHL